MTADPRVCPDALRVKVISFEEAAELAYFGAKVLHPATILPAVKKNIPVLVLNSRNPACEGTRIISRGAALQEPVQIDRGEKEADHHRHCGQPHADDARLPEQDVRHLRQAQVPGGHGFDQRGLRSRSRWTRTRACRQIAADLSKLADVKYEGKKALVCMVGEDIRGQNGIAAQVFNAIRHINVRMISQGASEINMSFMIEEDDADEAVRSLHAAFFKKPDPAIFDVEARKQFTVS